MVPMMLPTPAREIVQDHLDCFWEDADRKDARLLCLSGDAFYDHPVRPVAEIACRGEDGNCIALEDSLPLRTESITHVVMTHLLESAPEPAAMMAEIHRVMEPEGKLLLIVANRAGLWARRDDTLLGMGQPYTIAQIDALLRGAKLGITRIRPALMVPPMASDIWFSRLSHVLEPVAPFLPFFCGLHVVEAVKKVHALPPGTKSPVTEKAGWVKPAVNGGGVQPT